MSEIAPVISPVLPPDVSSVFDKVIQLDEDGYFGTDGLRVANIEEGAELLRSLRIDSSGRLLTQQFESVVLVENFDEPLVVKKIALKENGQATLTATYAYQEDFDLNSLRLDEWDRFKGRTLRGIPFVFSADAQNAFFDLVDSFDDDGFDFGGVTYQTPAWFAAAEKASAADFWSGEYSEGRAGWDLGEPSPALLAILPKLKLHPLRVLVLGAGSANDAAFLASLGHVVTAIDFSAEALARAKEKYGQQKGLKFLQADFFQLPVEMNETFDLVFEHTCYCAIDPARRTELMKVWRRMLSPNGYLLGVFFMIDRPQGLPWGATQWELRQRFGKGFRMLYWWPPRAFSHPKRFGMELLIFSQKLALT
jgi:SAM-dependent methyltransferase